MDAVKIPEAILARLNAHDKEKMAIAQITCDALGLKGQFTIDQKAGMFVPVVPEDKKE